MTDLQRDADDAKGLAASPEQSNVESWLDSTSEDLDLSTAQASEKINARQILGKMQAPNELPNGTSTPVRASKTSLMKSSSPIKSSLKSPLKTVHYPDTETSPLLSKETQSKDDLFKQIAQLTEENERLCKENEQLSEQNEQLVKTNTEVTNTNEQLTQANDSLAAEKSQLTDQLGKLSLDDKQVQSWKKKYEALLGNGKAITELDLGDLYTDLRLKEVDSLGWIEATNIIKNVLNRLQVPLDEMRECVVFLSTDVLNFVSELHKELHGGMPVVRWSDDTEALNHSFQLMLEDVRQLREARI